MKTVAVLLTNMFEDSEYTEPVAALKEAGYETVTVGLKEGETVKGKKKGTEVSIERAVENVAVRDLAAFNRAIVEKLAI